MGSLSNIFKVIDGIHPLFSRVEILEFKSLPDGQLFANPKEFMRFRLIAILPEGVDEKQWEDWLKEPRWILVDGKAYRQYSSCCIYGFPLTIHYEAHCKDWSVL